LSISSHLQQGHEYHLWVYEEIKVPEGTTLRYAGDILGESSIFRYQVGEGKGSVSAFSNLFRYCLLKELGGWWCDTDVVALRPFDFEEEYVFASEVEKNGSSVPTTCVMKVPQASFLVSHCYAVSMSVDKETLEWGTIGPNLWAEQIFKFGLEEYVQPPAMFCPTNWFDAEDDPVMHNRTIPERSYAVHMWHEMWRRKGINKNGSYPNSLYERLKECYITRPNTS